jgi:asparagine synthase (glutamine-hydrolysing)
MCGIFSLLNYQEPIDFIQEEFMRGKKRGPEFSKLDKIGPDCLFGFHRLAINGLNPESNQPIVHNHLSLVCNGEIYNYKELYEMMNVVPKTESDCEVILHLFERYGMDQTMQLLDGVFSFVLCEYNIHKDSIQLYVARDPYGVRPLYKVSNSTTHFIGFASEVKMLIQLVRDTTSLMEHFPPGHYEVYSRSFQLSSRWNFQSRNQYHSFGFQSILTSESWTDWEIIQGIQTYLKQAVKKRVQNTERPIACLLSGGLDSSLIAALVNEYYTENTNPLALETYSIGLEGSVDLMYAKKVADYLGTKHTEIVLSETEYLNSITEVIEAIESYDTTTVRASVGNYLVAKWISMKSDAKVIFNGDGADELFGGYLYMQKAPDALEFDKECRRLLKDIHMFDVLRSDKSISSNGLEPRTPFLDRSFVQYYLSIHPSIRYHVGNNQCEKFLLRQSFSQQCFTNRRGLPLLPEEVLWRRKEAFSDGIMAQKTARPIKDSIEWFAQQMGSSGEKAFYKETFDSMYPNMGHLVPYFWMPKYVEATDASARTLDLYKDKEMEEEKNNREKNK